MVQRHKTYEGALVALLTYHKKNTIRHNSSISHFYARILVMLGLILSSKCRIDSKQILSYFYYSSDLPNTFCCHYS